MSSLSVIMITKNEEQNLERALNSVSFADEIVIYDSNSTDKTREIAASYKCKFLVGEFNGFGDAKQKALEAASSEWVFSLDADEVVDEQLQMAIKEAIESDKYDSYKINRLSKFMGRWIKHSGWHPDYLVRLFRREQGKFSQNSVHEKIIATGSSGELAGCLLHYTDSTISHYLSKLNRYTSLSAEELNQQGKKFKVSYLLVKPFAIFAKMYFLKQGFKDGLHGLLLALLSSFHVLCKYAKLWELKQK